ncbi:MULTISPECIES: dipeptide ABC transporter ATP-binding protein [unclassified Streptomyces]|uniref:dipeptide ABC transporter ATP-binding protein n=1 Tax=unclassified Streptomyces TaxID=2593676 RepID=UPI00224E336A|nr:MULTISPECIES: ABC transporter ATP-binding protein [unclassified Streptomyces]WSP54829.1 ABC transporter ATP-binding protein [Streptomyces sp. NBC_01241]WSU24492.1 ABC transporter ATP-binding protein [Streptomyces sp. NBC_01108]MCX4797745.1 ABC transporter ATP-binding protein [Streptomyces sp. NBC_01242]WSJ39028.1 ABC transporter ATP-binding protein [Streptomyces sp. NBC_01321]WSP65319.1 ABC transporter ATP-binding protein [Streptomyces sp. NBC_01240]
MTATQGSAAPQAGPILELDDLGVVFTTETGEVPAVRGVSLHVRPGETLALVGESGSGKSTIALAATGLLAGNARATGSATIAGHQVVGAREAELAALRGRTVSMVFQEPATALDPLTRIGRQIAEVIRNHRKVSAKEAAAEAVELLRKVGIPEPERRATAYPFQLSGGQRQRVVIAMAIANEPALLIADEPTTALDVTVQAEILDLLRRLAVETGTGVLLVTHNMGVVADFADRVAVMYHGEIVETGPVEDVLLRPSHEYTERLLAAVPRLSVAEEGRPAAPTAAARPDTDPVVELHDISVVFGHGKGAVRALDGVSLAVHAGETLGLVGESGSGKSTASRVALGLIPPSSGTVSLFGTDLGRTRSRARRALRAGIGVVLQDPVASLDARMTVGECVAEPLRVHRRELSAKDRQSKVAAVLERVRLPRELARRTPRELSGGQRQRVSLARALVLEPRLLVADEPTSALDVSVQEAVLEVISELQHELGFACLFVSHDLAVVQHFAQRVAVMRAGRIEEQGPTGATLLHPETDYTRRLLAAVPVPDPVIQRGRRAERLATLAAGRTEAQV